ncbi:hypothetical protein [Caulobacter endophyticus]|uniref:Uncharacterized protein n=1 Tax=Caulobacter endophyticus TaxID=2172652 RepID=A0A2T9JYL7_9CAUL|nr:hypothetical protein [Caulobacter endophyticus]PVM88822.1 hypothetical protein DDF67_12645 [Caulobacter endophyticus]
MGLAGGLAVHLLLFSVLISGTAARQAGLTPLGVDDGLRQGVRGLSLSLVNLPDQRSEGRALSGATTPRSTASPSPPRPRPRPDQSLLAVEEEAKRQTAAEDMTAQTQDTLAASSPARGETSLTGRQAGDPDGAENLLRQIARCLPVDRAPNIGGSTLNISLAADGRLAAAPDLTFAAGTASSQRIEEANLVIQAALQCGPYAMGGKPAQVALAPDFSFLAPSSLTGERP